MLSGAVSFLVPMIFGLDAPPPGAMEGAGQADPEMIQDMATRVMSELSKQNWLLVTTSFIIFFLGGYFIYASMFAAVGSAMGEDSGESQALKKSTAIWQSVSGGAASGASCGHA